MDKQGKILIPGLVLGTYSFVMFTAAGFFYNNYLELMATCGRYSLSDCQANESIIVSSVSLRIGTVVFFMMGTFAWALASYLLVRWVRLRGSLRLP
jgi:hypothetical protein